MARRRQPEVGADFTSDATVPEEIRAGPCIEVWAHGAIGPQAGTTAFGRHRRARRAWLASIGVGPYDHALVPAHVGGTTPWSYWYVLERYGRDKLLEHLRALTLPDDWEPVPLVEDPDYGPNIVPEERRRWAGARGKA